MINSLSSFVRDDLSLKVNENQSRTKVHEDWFSKNVAGLVQMSKDINTFESRLSHCEKAIDGNPTPDHVSRLESRLKRCEEAINSNPTPDHVTRLENCEKLVKDVQASQNSTEIPSEKKEVVDRITRNVAERFDRQYNIVIFNLTESNSNVKVENEAFDKAAINELCEVTAGEKCVYTSKRLGKKVTAATSTDEGPSASQNVTSDPRPRPLLVQFERYESKLALMKGLYKLGHDGTPEYLSRVSIKHDMTPDERIVDKGLQADARQKNEQNQDLNIRYVVRGPPWERKVVTVKIKRRKEGDARAQSQGTTTQNQ